MGTDAVAPARMPRELKRAGFDVALLAPRDSFAAHTGFADHIGHVPEGVTLYHLLTRKYPYGEIEPFQTPRFGEPIPPTRYRPACGAIVGRAGREPRDPGW